MKKNTTLQKSYYFKRGMIILLIGSILFWQKNFLVDIFSSVIIFRWYNIVEIILIGLLIAFFGYFLQLKKEEYRLHGRMITQENQEKLFQILLYFVIVSIFFF